MRDVVLLEVDQSMITSDIGLEQVRKQTQQRSVRAKTCRHIFGNTIRACWGTVLVNAIVIV